MNPRKTSQRASERADATSLPWASLCIGNGALWALVDAVGPHTGRPLVLPALTGAVLCACALFGSSWLREWCDQTAGERSAGWAVQCVILGAAVCVEGVVLSALAMGAR